MICYRHALKRHSKTPIFRNLKDQADWLEVEVGVKNFWDYLQHGQLVAFEDGQGVYVGIVDEYDHELENGHMWIYFKPDPSRDPLPAHQDTLPVAFGIRDKIMMEIA